jgi:transposase InsO family protein
MDRDDRKSMAVVRVSVLGPLISARLEHGDKAQLFEEAAARTYEGIDGRAVKVSARTVEDWYYSWVHEGLDGLMPRQRSDSGMSRVISPEVGEKIVQLKEELPRRSIRRIIRILERDGQVAKGALTKSTVHRYLKRRGLSGRPRRAYEERLAYRHACAGDLWMGDVMHGPKVIAPDGKERKAYLHLLLDSATRFVPACAFRLGETATDLQVVLKEGIAKHGLARVLYFDRGAAQRADSLRVICAELGIRLLHCKAYDPEAKAGVERIFRTIREELLDEVGDRLLALAELNSLLWSWLSTEYHRRLHGGTCRVPLEHWLSQVDKLRRSPRGEVLDEVFLHRERRKVRKDSTVRFGGRFLEVRPELVGQKVELRFDPEKPQQLPRVYVGGELFCDTSELDVIRNSSRRRRRIVDLKETESRPDSGLDPLAQIQAEHERRSAPPRSRRTVKE